MERDGAIKKWCGNVTNGVEPRPTDASNAIKAIYEIDNSSGILPRLFVLASFLFPFHFRDQSSIFSFRVLFGPPTTFNSLLVSSIIPPTSLHPHPFPYPLRANLIWANIHKEGPMLP